MTQSSTQIPVGPALGNECADCTDRLGDALTRHLGVATVDPFPSGRLTVTYDPALCNPECLLAAAAGIGTGLRDAFRHADLSVQGMDCYGCAQTIELAAARVEGVTHCRVNLPAARLALEYDTAHPQTRAELQRVVEKLGYRLEPVPQPGPSAPVAEPVPATPPRRLTEWITGLSALATVSAIVAGLAGFGTAETGLYALAVVTGGLWIARSGLLSMIATRRLDINVLMTIAVIGAMAIDAWMEAALVVVLFRIGENLESYAVGRARRSLQGLLELTPQSAHRVSGPLAGGPVEDVPAGSLVVSDLVAVRPGERLPADGEVVQGISNLNQAPITGESIPVRKEAGERVFAGSINGEGLLIVRVGNPPGDSTLDRVARAVTEAQAQRSPAERWVNSFARVYTPIVLGVALSLTAIPPLVFGQGWSDWIYRGLAFLILACPCALVISTPVAVVAALARASQAGVLVKGGAHLEAATRLRAIAFDKTGTLTMGEPVVTEISAATPFTRDDVLTLAAAVDAASEHPLARAIVDAAASAGLTVPSATGFESIRGYGTRARVGTHTVTVGNLRLFEDHPRFADIRASIDDISARGNATVAVTRDDRVVGVLGIADRARPEAASALADLRRAGIEHVVLLTGDNASSAGAVARETGITEVRANLLPGDKVTHVVALQSEFGPTAMIGDGVNDTPALARSALGIAMGGAGSPAAIETADVVLMGDDLRKLAGLLAHAGATRNIVRQNIAFSLGTKAVAAGFAVAGMLPLWLAVLTDVGATLVVVGNGLRLLRMKLDPPLDL